jgi:hypothetical protein
MFNTKRRRGSRAIWADRERDCAEWTAKTFREIVEELRGHIQEKTEAAGEIKMATVDAVLAALGSPEELASQYVTDDLLARAEVSRSPWRTLEGLFHWASLSVVANHASISFLIDVPRSELCFEPRGLNRFRPNLSFCGRR